MTEPNYFYRFCCNIPEWVETQATNEDDPAASFKSICPCPYITPVYRSTSQVKNIAGVTNDNRFYEIAETTGYTTDFKFSAAGDHFSQSITAPFKKTQTASCDGEDPEITTTYEGTVTVTGEDEECDPISYAPGFYHVTKYISKNKTADWGGGTEIQVGTYNSTDHNTEDAAYEIKGWAYADSCDPDDDDMISHTFHNSILTVDDGSTTTEFINCPKYCNVGDETNGTSGISFIPCGASTLGLSDTGTKTSVKYALIFKSLRVNESYQGYARVQYRDYLANYGVLEAPSAEANWQEDDVLEVTSFTADKTYKIIGGTLNVPVADFEAQNLSTSIYSYPNNFYDPSTEEWNTDGQVIIANTDLEEISGYQFRIKEFWVRRSSDPECA
jgi:hypothetical protein